MDKQGSIYTKVLIESTNYKFPPCYCIINITLHKNFIACKKFTSSLIYEFLINIVYKLERTSTKCVLTQSAERLQNMCSLVIKFVRCSRQSLSVAD